MQSFGFEAMHNEIEHELVLLLFFGIFEQLLADLAIALRCQPAGGRPGQRIGDEPPLADAQ
jgi:hypothetical protein